MEGAVDVIAVSLGGHIGLAASGTRLTTHHAEHLRQVLAATGGPLLLAYDNDSPGQDATLRAADPLAGLDAQVVQLPAGHDPADVVVATGFRGLGRALGESVPLVDSAITTRLRRWASHTGNPVALVDAVREVAPPVTGAPGGDRARLVSLIASQLGLPVEVVSGTLLDAAAPA